PHQHFGARGVGVVGGTGATVVCGWSALSAGTRGQRARSWRTTDDASTAGLGAHRESVSANLPGDVNDNGEQVSLFPVPCRPFPPYRMMFCPFGSSSPV